MRSGLMPAREWHLGRSTSLVGVALATLAPTLAAGLTLGVGLAAAPAANAAPPSCTTAGLITTCTFGFTGAPQDWPVPAGVQQATFTVTGAAGAVATGGGDRPGGRGGRTTATLPTPVGQTFRLFVGGTPSDRLGGWNGGGDGGEFLSGGGGGASDVRMAPYGLAHRLLVAGGGGGAGGLARNVWRIGVPGAGGSGGGPGVAGLQGQNVSGAIVGAGGGGGGGAAAGGFGGGPAGFVSPPENGCHHTHGGSAGVWGAGGSGGHISYNHDGTAPCYDNGGLGGGGGGGWYGGGGGGGGTTGGAGGGGGSGFGPAGSTAGPLGEPGAQGSITVSYRTPASGWVDLAGGGQLTSAPTAVLRPETCTPPRPRTCSTSTPTATSSNAWSPTGSPAPRFNHGAVLHPGSTIAAAWGAATEPGSSCSAAAPRTPCGASRTP